MIIRPMTEDDIKILVGMGDMAHKESAYNVLSFDASKCTTLGNLILCNPETLCCLVAEKDDKIVGFLMASISEAYFSVEKVASDLLVYVLPDYRGSRAFLMLIASYVRWSKEHGAKLVFLGNTFGDSTVDALYIKLGFRHMGGLFRMEV